MSWALLSRVSVLPTHLCAFLWEFQLSYNNLLETSPGCTPCQKIDGQPACHYHLRVAEPVHSSLNKSACLSDSVFYRWTMWCLSVSLTPRQVCCLLGGMWNVDKVCHLLYHLVKWVFIMLDWFNTMSWVHTITKHK